LSNNLDPKTYFRKIRRKDTELAKYVKDNCLMVEMLTHSDKKRKSLVGNTENIFRIIQSINTPQSEPLKNWLAVIGYQKIQELEKPIKTQDKLENYYRSKGYSDDWINKRLLGIAIHQDLINEWNKAGVKDSADFATLARELSKSTFVIRPSEHLTLKNLSRTGNLRDNLTDLELILLMLSESATAEISRTTKPKNIKEAAKVAKKGGSIAGIARRKIEKATGKSFIDSKSSN
jgi:DNA-damage-inducible protein D